MIANEKQIESLKKGGKILAEIIQKISDQVKPGATPKDLEKLTGELLSSYSVAPSFLDYRGYPSVICLSVNDQAVHAVPSNKPLQEGDLLKIDMGVVYDGLHTDSAVTVIVGDGSKKEFAAKRKLVVTTRQALRAGLDQVKIGNKISAIGRAIQKVVEDGGFAVIRELGGHGVGKTLHEDPFVPNYYDPDYDQEIVVGMVLALEPITSDGGWRIKNGKDGHAYLTKDGSLSAHFEHTVVATEKGPIIVTK